MSTLAITGSAVDTPGGTISRPFDLRVPCSPDPAGRLIALTSDMAATVGLDGLSGVHALYLEANAPVTANLTFAAGSPQAVKGETIIIVSRAVAITAISLVRVAGQATTVRLILGQGA